MLISKKEDGFFLTGNEGMLFTKNNTAVHNPSFCVKGFFCLSVCLVDSNERSFCCSGPGKYSYSPERLKKTELCQTDEFHLGRRKGRRSSG